MRFYDSNSRRKLLTLVLIAFVIVNVFGLMILLPTPAYAQWVVTDPITGANTTIRNITDFIRVVLIGVLGTALLNGLWYFSQRIAYDTAIWVASGGKGQDSLIFQQGFGTYLGNVALDGVAEVIGSIDTGNLGFDLCRPPDLSQILSIQLGIAQRFQPPTPRCSWNDLSQNWDAFVSQATSGEVLEGLANSFRPGQSGLEVAFTLGSRSHEWSLRKELEATEDRREGGGFKPVLDIISGSIVTPSQAVHEKVNEDLTRAESQQRQLTNEQAASALAAGAFQLLPATLTIFANTLLSELTTKFFEGLFAPEPLRERGPLLTINPEASSQLKGRARAQAVFADLLTPHFVEVQNYDALTEFMTCPGVNRGPNNCVVDAAFSSVIRISDSGVPLTVAEALKQGALHADWRLIPPTDGKNQDPNCYTEAYCYSNLVKLRRARIIPIGWELAAEAGARKGIVPTLGEAISHFYDCDPETGGISDSHPWCHLIDPNWVLKYPVTQCRVLAKGPTLLAAETSVRADTCVDPVSCIAKDDKGNCVSYGYCTREQNIWQMPGQSCPARYDSCQSYRKVLEDGKPEKEAFLLTNTLDFNGCTAEVAGCSWYSTARTSSVTANLLEDPSFEAALASSKWSATVEADHSENGTQAFHGASSYKVPLGDGITQRIAAVDPNKTYTLSFYAKQEAPSAEDSFVEARLILRNAAGDTIGDAGFPLDARTDGITLTNCAWNVDSLALTFSPGTGYRRAECRFTTSASADSAELELHSLSAPRHYVDAIQLEESARATIFHEGAGLASGWQRDNRIYFNRNVSSCGAGDDGCTDLILKGAGISKNLFKNSSFEFDDDPSAVQIDFWTGTRGDNAATPDFHENYSRDSSQSFHGSSAVRVGDESGADGPLLPSEDIFLEPETTYSFSYYAKQSTAGGTAPAKAKMWITNLGGSLVAMDNRTDCPLVDGDGDGEAELMILSMTPGDLYRRASCTFTTPTIGGGKPEFNVHLYGDPAFQIWIDAVQLEEGLTATEYRETGYTQNAAHAYFKIPPDYLNCRGTADDAPECSNYTLMCSKEDTNCELYTPTDGSPSVPGIVTSDKLCPAECVGYTTFRQEETSFERAKYPLFFIAATGEKCEAQYAGCDEFTNLESSAVEYYSYLRQCIRPGAESATYYTWEGSDTAGFQLKVWSFKRGDVLAGRVPAERGRPPVYRPGFTDFAACTRDIFRSGTNPDCREFYDIDGNISYRLYSELVVSTPECNRYRRSETTATRAECEESGGTWDDVGRSCTFLGFPIESRSCPAEKNGCRAYTGNAGRNVRIISRANFEGGEKSGFIGGELSSESVFVGGHSLQLAAGATELSVGTGDGKIRNGGTYIISFMVKGSGLPVIKFSGAGARVEKYFANANFEVRNDWQRYTLGPILVDWDVPEDEALEFSGFGNPSFIDDFEMREVAENVYLIKDSWTTPESCDQAPDGSPFPQAMLGCSEYRTSGGTSVTITGFDRLCSEAAIGCRAVIDTRNSPSLEEERYNLTCSIDGADADRDPDTCGSLSCTCKAFVNGAERNVCQISRGQTSCRFNSIGPASATVSEGLNYDVSVEPDSVIVPEDITKYLILDPAKSCRAEAAGCTLYGDPTEGVCDLGAVCASPDGRCNCAVASDVVCQVPAGSRTCSYKIPRYLLDGSGANYGTVTLKNDPSAYGQTLCTNEFLGCEEWQRGNTGLAYFKDPVDQQCEYKENVTVRGVTTSGWFKKGLINEPCDPAFAVGGTQYEIRKNGDPQYKGWAGICERQFVGCTAYLDPADSSDITPQGRPYYIIKDKKLEEGNTCGGRVSQKEGCVLFKDSSVPLNQYSSEATYAVSAHDNYGLVPVSSCPGGAGCKRCGHNFEYTGLFEVDACTAAGGRVLIPAGGEGVFALVCQLEVHGSTCIEDKDCEGDDVDSPPGGDLISSRCVDAPASAPVGNDSNIILKVTRDRQCAEWLDCKTLVTVWDSNEKKFKKVCTQLGRCDSFVTTADGIKCANYKSAEYSGDILTTDLYVDRDISWYGQEYAGFSIPNHYPIEDLQPIDYDKTAKQDIRLAYVACEQDNGPDRNCDLRSGAKPGACRRTGFACGIPNALGNRGTCVTPGGAGAIPVCAYGIDGTSVPAQPEVKPRKDPATLVNALPPEQCRAYPEQDSPFPFEVSNWTQGGLPLGRNTGFQQANVCERFAWSDKDGDGLRDTNPAWPDPRAELVPQDCECNYSKVIYNGKSFTKYYSYDEGKVPLGICQGGPRSGETCIPGAVYNDKRPHDDKENLKTCGPPNQSGICQRVERIDKVIGLPGQCLERDLSLSLNGIPDNYACLTWNPLGIVPGGADIYNQYAAAGYSPTGSTGRYFCVEARGNAGGANQSYEAMYTSELEDIRIGGNNVDYEEHFYSSDDLFSGAGGPTLYEKDIAAIRLTTTEDWNDNPPDQAMKEAIEKSVEDEANVLSRLGIIGVTGSGRHYWEAAFNISSGQAPPRAFVYENRMLAGETLISDSGNCNNSFPGNTYVIVRALFDDTPAREFLGLWTSFCSANDDDVDFTFDVNMHFAEPCEAIARVEGSNAAFTDRAWIGSGYQVSDEFVPVSNVQNSPYGTDVDTYDETLMLGYGYDTRNPPFGSAASTQEPFGIDAWQVNGPDGFGSPYLRYIPAAIDAGSPYGCFERRDSVAIDEEGGGGIPVGNSCGANLRCAASPSGFEASISLNFAKACINRSGCPLQAVCNNNPDVACSADADCGAGNFCSAKHCGNEAGYNNVVCKEDTDCEGAFTCRDELAFAECTDQFRQFGSSIGHCEYAGGFVDETACDEITDCDAFPDGECVFNNEIPAPRRSPLEFLFAKSFGIWRWQPEEGELTIGQCVGGTPVDGNSCEDDAECRNVGGLCEEEEVCSGGPQHGVQCSADTQCQGIAPIERAICRFIGDGDLGEIICADGPNVNDECTEDVDSDGDEEPYEINCYPDTAVCSPATSRCTGGAFESSVITNPGATGCPPGWVEEGGRCRLVCSTSNGDNDCRYSASTCGSVQLCNGDSGVLSGLSCTASTQCNYPTGTCNETTVIQPAGYQQEQSLGGSSGWDNRQTSTLGTQPYVPTIASPDISACDGQSQRCRVQGLAVGVNNKECFANSDCQPGWTCSGRGALTRVITGDSDGFTCEPPRGLDTNALSINNRTLGDLRGAGSFRATLRFYAWADHNAMPITSRTVDWGDGLLDKTVNSKYKNHKAICSAGDADDSASKECQGMPGLTCAKQADCPAGTGLCVPVGKCSISLAKCSVDDDCSLQNVGERCVLSRFGNAPSACDEQYFEFEHTYICNRDLLARLPDCTGADLDPTNKNTPHTACARDLNNDSSADACLFRPKVQVKDNWGYCNGICPGPDRGGETPGGLRCFESECDVHPGAWTGYGGFITITPRN